MDVEDSEYSQPRPKNKRTRLQKYRMSCDACSNTKTKCDQTRPRCLRCQKSGLDCNYSISQRKGKPPMLSRNQSKLSSEQKKETSQANLDIAMENQSLHEERSPYSTLELEQMYEGATLEEWQNGVAGETMFETDDMFSTTFDPNPIPPNITNEIHSNQFKFPDDIFHFDSSELPGMQDPIPQPMLYQMESLIPTSTSSTPIPSSIPINDCRYHKRPDCLGIATSTLASLNSNTQTCGVSPNANTCSISFDQILITNESAIENVHQLLSCPCSLSQQSTLMLALIIEKILTLYQSNLHTDSSLNKSSPASDVSREEYVHHPPITIGKYKIDARDEKWMRMHILSKEVRKASSLVERYADGHCGLKFQDREDKGIYIALTNLLRRRLKEVANDIENALHSCQD